MLMMLTCPHSFAFSCHGDGRIAAEFQPLRRRHRHQACIRCSAQMRLDEASFLMPMIMASEDYLLLSRAA